MSLPTLQFERIWNRTGTWLLSAGGQAISVGSRRLKCAGGHYLNSIALVAIILIHGGILAKAATLHSPTDLEPAFLVAGLSHWEFGRFELFRVNPPLVRMVAALPVLAAGYKLEWSDDQALANPRAEIPLGTRFVASNGDRSLFLFTIARWACIPFSVIGAVVAFHWANELYGSPSGLVAAVLWCFEPTILGHAELITTDCAAAGLGLLAGYTFWRWLKAATLVSATIAGFALGIAQLAKMTWIILFPLWPLLWGIWMVTNRRVNAPSQGWLRGIVQISWIALLGLYVINLGYCFDRTFLPLGEFEFASKLLADDQTNPESPNRFGSSHVSKLPVPLPEQYVLGADVQYRDFEKYGAPSYLRGNWQNHGWWYYYLYALLVKQTHGAQLLALAAIVSLAYRFDIARCRDELMMMAPFCAVFAVVSMQLEFNHHFRYVLPFLGGLSVFSARVIPCLRWCSGRTFPIALAAVLGALVYSVSTVIAAYPNELRYFNPLSGGLQGGQRHLLHSSLDWGQDNRVLLDLWKRDPTLRSAPTHLVGSYIPGVATELTLHDGQESPNSSIVNKREIWSKVVYLQRHRHSSDSPQITIDAGAIFVVQVE
jgi:hypothetical protein